MNKIRDTDVLISHASRLKIGNAGNMSPLLFLSEYLAGVGMRRMRMLCTSFSGLNAWLSRRRRCW